MNGEHDIIWKVATGILTIGIVPIVYWIVRHERTAGDRRAQVASMETTLQNHQEQLGLCREQHKETEDRVGEVEAQERSCREEILKELSSLTKGQALTNQSLKHIAVELRRRNGVPVHLESDTEEAKDG